MLLRRVLLRRHLRFFVCKLTHWSCHRDTVEKLLAVVAKKFKKQVASRTKQEANHVITSVMQNKVRFTKQQVD